MVFLGRRGGLDSAEAGEEEFGVGAGVLEIADEDFHGLGGGEFRELAAEKKDALVFVGVEEEFVAAGSGFDDLNGWKNPHFGDGAVEVQLHVAGAFKLFEDEVVHAAFGFDKGGAEDGEAAAFFGVAGGSKKFAGLGEGLGIDAAAHGATFAGLEVVVGAGHAGDGVEEDDDIASEFDEALGTVGDAFADLDMAGHGFVKCGCVDFTIEGSPHVGDFLRALVDEEENEGGLGMVDADAAGEGLEKNRLSSSGRRGDETSLAHTQRSDEIHGARREFRVPWRFQEDAAVGKKRREFVELQRGLPLAGGYVFDG